MTRERCLYQPGKDSSRTDRRRRPGTCNAPDVFRRPAALLFPLLVAVSGCAAAHGGPVVGSGELPPDRSGTIAGIVRAAGSNSPLAGRRVTAVEVRTGATYEATTAANGGYTLKVPVGRYRLQVELRGSEFVSEGPDEVVLNRSDLDSGRDFVISIKP